KGVHTVEEFDPDPYLDALDKYGLPRSESHVPPRLRVAVWWKRTARMFCRRSPSCAPMALPAL
ncbi:hypothetical protein, partial [Faecalibacterium sp. DFI.5.82]|uniref:hypothetical protein n=1 Tax=Faecalibacterium sp. DFI.5.82 TaxID=3031725 RepID=UPI0023B1816D